MLTIKFDPNGGLAIPDGQVEQFAREVVELHTATPRDETVSVSNALTINAFRLMIVRNAIDHDKIQFMFDGEVIKINEYASPEKWPEGFCTHERDFVIEIMRSRSSKLTPK